MKVSWQPSSNLKKSLVDEFEHGITCNVVDVVSPSYGSTAHTPVVSQQLHDGPPPSKRNRVPLLHHQIMGIFLITF